MLNFAERLQLLIDCKKIDQSEFSSGAKFHKTQVSKWLSGSTDTPQRKTVVRIADYFGCDVKWLETGEGNPFPDHETPEAKLLRTYKGTLTKSASMGWKNEQAASGQSGDPENEHDIPASEMLIMTSVVLESNTVYRSALASNIRAFYQAVKGEQEMSDLRDEIKKMREELAEMKELILSQGTAEKKRAGNDD